LLEAATKLSQWQWKKLLWRVMQKEGGRLTEDTAKELMEKGGPYTERTLGALYGPHPNPSLAEAGVRSPEYLPIDEARAKYYQNPEQYIPGGSRPPVDELKQVPQFSPEDFAAGIAWRRNKFAPVVPPQVRGAMGVMNRDITQTGAEKQLGQMGLAPEDVQPSPEKFLKQQGVEPPSGELKQVLGDALEADQIWREMAGGAGTPEADQLMVAQSAGWGGSRTRTTAATQLWQRLLDLQSGGVKQAFKNPKDWFMASWGRFKRNPAEFEKKHPREAGLLRRIKQLYEGRE
jgi:hypothetical protein